MGKKLVSKTAKVLSETKKSKDKEAVAIAYEHIPRNPEEQAHGALYAVLELADKSGRAEEIAEAIIDAFHNEYYSDTAREPLASFESALAKINEELADRSSEGQIDWLGKLNGVLAVLSGTTIHLTQAGKAEAYLYRTDHAMHITEDLAGDAVNPMRTFINIASGDLSENDRLALVTPGVFLKISKNELKKYVTENSPKNAVTALSQLLSASNGGALPNSILLMEMCSPEAFAAEPEPEQPTEAWVKDEKKPLEEVGAGTVHGAARAFDVIGKAAGAASTFIAARAIPAVKSGTAKVTDKVASIRKEPDAERIILESEEQLSHGSELRNEDQNDGILETPVKKEGYSEIRIKESDHHPKRLNLERFSFAKGNFFKSPKLPKLGRPKKSGIFLIAGVILAGSLIFGLAYYQNNQKIEAAAQNQMTQATEKYNEGLDALSTGDRTAALDDFSAAESLAKSAQTTDTQKDKATKLLSDISVARDQAMGVVKNTAELFHDFGSVKPDAIYTNGTMIYALTYSNGAVYAVDPKSKSQATVISDAGLTDPIKFSAFYPTRNVIVAVTTGNDLYEISLGTKKALKQVVTGGLAEGGVALATYGTANIYLLVPTENQIYKYVDNGYRYGAQTEYIKTGVNTDITGGTSLAIDSSIYVTSAGGTITKFTSGLPDEFSVKGYPQSYTGIAGIFADADTAGQYLYAKDYIIAVDGNENFQAQYKSDDLSDIKSIFALDDSRSLFVLSGNKIYTISY